MNKLRPIGILLLALFSFLAAQGTGIRLFFQLFYLLLALLLLSFLWAWSNLRGLRVSRETFVRRAQVGEQARERLTVENRWPLPKLWVELRDQSDLPLHGAGFVTYCRVVSAAAGARARPALCAANLRSAQPRW